MKTSAQHLEALRFAVSELHSYDTSPVIMLADDGITGI